MTAKAIAVRVPRETVNDETVILVEWKAKEGELVKSGQVVAEIETSKAVLEVTAPETGFLRPRFKKAEKVGVGEVLFFLTDDPSSPVPRDPHAEAAARAVPSEDQRFSAKAQALINKHQIDKKSFEGMKLVRERDVLAVIAARGTGSRAANAEALGVPTRRELLPERKVTEIRYLSAGQNAGLASSVSILCPTRGLREKARRRSDWGGSLTGVIVLEAAKLLRKFPAFNAFYEAGAIHYYERVNIGIVIDAGRGIQVPVIHDADRRNLPDIVTALQKRLTGYFLDEKDVAAVSGGTFTFTDLSAEGAFGLIPLINYRQSAILSIGGEFFPPDCRSGIFQLTLTFDHRLTEGRAASMFLRELADRIKDYEEESGER